MIPSLEVDFVRQSAKVFVHKVKGRLPQTAEELIDWLLEFTDHEVKSMRLTNEIFREHMEVCTRPLLLSKLWKENEQVESKKTKS